jgi:hypothetical protein
MPNDQQCVSIVPATANTDLLEAGIKKGAIIYLSWDRAARRFFVVQWDRVRWVCSCGTPACTHRLAANTYVFELSLKDRTGAPELRSE